MRSYVNLIYSICCEQVSIDYKSCCFGQNNTNLDIPKIETDPMVHSAFLLDGNFNTVVDNYGWLGGFPCIGDFEFCWSFIQKDVV